MKKFSRILLMVMCLILAFTSCVMAENEDGSSPATGGKGFSGITGGAKAPGNAADTANAIIGAMQWIGYAIAIGMLVFIGIKYVMASANEKADLKNSLIKYVIGAILIAGAVTIGGWIFKIV